ncbi:MAG: DegT/DnrJ/EryC1/StrS family aminotransferase [Actinomycetia bacterium]|nr:DegT/DnrJ/EryC1/StrS family aminotransferase [Actinomycetes bacterium]
MQVPFIDLRIQHQVLRPALEEAFRRVMDRCDFALGQDVLALEEEFSAFCGTQYAIGVASGISALELSLRAYGIGPGDEVIIPGQTFMATAAAVSFSGALPVLIDVDLATHNIDVTQIEAAITFKTRAIIPVHFYGIPADMDPIMALANKHNLKVIEDACQAHGSTYKNRRAGALGHAAAFSFYPTKNLGACGDAGIVVTNDEDVANAIRAMRNCGQTDKHRHELAPFNYRLDTLQAALLRVKLPYLDEWIQKRRAAAALYTELLADSDTITPVENSDSTHVYHLYVIRSAHRDALQEHLKTNGIGTSIHYPYPIHSQQFYTQNPDSIRYGKLAHTEQLCQEILSLPMFPEITEEQVRHVAHCVRAFLPEQVTA